MEVQGNLVEVQDQFQKYKKENENLRKKVSYWKNTTLKLENQSSEKDSYIKEKLSFKIKELEQIIKFIENENNVLKQKIDHFENKKLNLFQKGQYSKEVRTAYQDLISDGGVSASKIRKSSEYCFDQNCRTSS